MAAWLEEAETLSKRLPDHRRALERLRNRGSENPPGHGQYDTTEEAWNHEVLSSVILDLDRLEGNEGVLAPVRARHESAATLQVRSLEEYAKEWEAMIDAIAASPRYGGLVLTPQTGLVPLGPGPDRDSGLFECAHLGSGSIPARDPRTGALVYTDHGDGAIVLVLIPGGTFGMGAQKQDPDGPNYDPEADECESDGRLSLEFR